MKGAISKLAALAAITDGMMPEIKFTAKDKREMKRKPNYKPPRSMTPEEKEYYDKHKHLNGLYR